MVPKTGLPWGCLAWTTMLCSHKQGMGDYFTQVRGSCCELASIPRARQHANSVRGGPNNSTFTTDFQWKGCTCSSAFVHIFCRSRTLRGALFVQSFMCFVALTLPGLWAVRRFLTATQATGGWHCMKIANACQTLAHSSPYVLVPCIPDQPLNFFYARGFQLRAPRAHQVESQDALTYHLWEINPQHY
jgi:hypothetical protein